MQCPVNKLATVTGITFNSLALFLPETHYDRSS